MGLAQLDHYHQGVDAHLAAELTEAQRRGLLRSGSHSCLGPGKRRGVWVRDA